MKNEKITYNILKEFDYYVIIKNIEHTSGIISFRIFDGTYRECVSKRKEILNEKKKIKINT